MGAITEIQKLLKDDKEFARLGGIFPEGKADYERLSRDGAKRWPALGIFGGGPMEDQADSNGGGQGTGHTDA